MESHIYCIKNVLNNKVYIGSSKAIKARKYEHFRLLKNGNHHSIHLQKAYNKYGKDKFFFYVIEECTSETRKERELYHILINNAHIRDHGYNIYEPNDDKFKCSESTKNKMYQATKSKDIPIEVDTYDLSGNLLSTHRSMSHCGKFYGMKSSVVLRILKGQARSHKGMTFTKKGEPFSYQPSKKQRDMSKFQRTK